MDVEFSIELVVAVAQLMLHTLPGFYPGTVATHKHFLNLARRSPYSRILNLQGHITYSYAIPQGQISPNRGHSSNSFRAYCFTRLVCSHNAPDLSTKSHTHPEPSVVISASESSQIMLPLDGSPIVHVTDTVNEIPSCVGAS